MTFQIGDKVIYPNHGLGVVQTYREPNDHGYDCGFYQAPHGVERDDGARSVENADSVGLRKAVGMTKSISLYGLLADGKIDTHQNWKGRFKDNSDRMRTGSLYDVVEVLKSLSY